MKTSRAGSNLPRRDFFRALAVTAGVGSASYGFGQVPPAEAGTVRDKLWMFGSPVNSDYEYVHKRSVMTAVEANFYYQVPNIMMVQDYPPAGHEAHFKAWEPPFEQYALPLKLLKRVEWSIVGGAGVHKGWETTEVLDMAFRTPNFTGIYMDDFFHGDGKGSLSLDELREIRQRLKGPDKTLSLNTTLYTYQLDLPIAGHLQLIDKATLWTWKYQDLANLDENLTKLHKLVPKLRIMLGCYVGDYETGASIPIPAMQHQCETGLRGLRDGRLEGIVFIGNTLMDLGFESSEWTRQWIQKVGETRI